MPRSSAITPDLLAEIVTRRGAGEEWKCIARDFRARGLPCDPATLWRAYAGRTVTLRNAETACATAGYAATP